MTLEELIDYARERDVCLTVAPPSASYTDPNLVRWNAVLDSDSAREDFPSFQVVVSADTLPELAAAVRERLEELAEEAGVADMKDIAHTSWERKMRLASARRLADAANAKAKAKA